ncbi:MAG: hypothetical protein QOD86_25 [Miltoncostaeaceae bacterium]|nr:hypothetical protein [Miltoncostaeaceae bacterium]
MKVAFVVPRYGGEVAGGAEALCRSTARALAGAGDEVTVYTTTARDSPGFEDHYAAGAEDEGGVRVLRFPAERPDPALAAALLRRLSVGAGGPDEEAAWSRAQGPVSRPLLAALAQAPRRHEVVAVWTYLSATSHLGMPLVADRAVLAPMAHDEPMVRFGVTRGLTRMAAGFAFLTPEERRLVDEAHGIGGRPEAVVGAGLDPAPDGAAARARRDGGVPRRFALYLGRVDAAKGIDALVRAHSRYRDAGGPLGLVMAGRTVAGTRLPRWVVATGFVSPERRADLLAAAEVVVLPSPHESLSLAALEAWAAGRPTLAIARSEVLAGQTARSGGGLLYTDAISYRRQLSRLASDPELRELLGGAGRRFAAALDWPACARRWRALLAQVRRPLSR